MNLRTKLYLPAILAFGASCSLGQTPDGPGFSDKWLGRDKLAHFTVSLATVGFSNHWLENESGVTPGVARRGSVSFSLALGTVKEFYDSTKKGNRFSFKDLAADIAGTALGAVLFTIN